MDSPPSGRTPDYLPIAEHGVIGDQRSVAPVGTDGAVLREAKRGPAAQGDRRTSSSTGPIRPSRWNRTPRAGSAARLALLTRGSRRDEYSRLRSSGVVIH